MTGRLLVLAAVCCVSGGAVIAKTRPPAIPKGSSFEERVAVAKKVKTITDILGVQLGATLAEAHAKLDPLSDPARPWMERKGERGEMKAVWQLEKTPFASIYIKTNEKREIEQITGFVRPGEEIPFEQIGEIKKAPLLNDNAVVWDVIRPDRPQMRVGAEGKERKASVIKLLAMPRRGP